MTAALHARDLSKRYGQKLAVRDVRLAVATGEVVGLLGLAATYAQADLVVAADTGPLHIAATAGTRVVALFGPKDPNLYGPRGEGHRVLSHSVPCRPCTRRSCASPQCVLGIEVDAVERAIREMLAR